LLLIQQNWKQTWNMDTGIMVDLTIMKHRVTMYNTKIRNTWWIEAIFCKNVIKNICITNLL